MGWVAATNWCWSKTTILLASAITNSVNSFSFIRLIQVLKTSNIPVFQYWLDGGRLHPLWIISLRNAFRLREGLLVPVQEAVPTAGWICKTIADLTTVIECSNVLEEIRNLQYSGCGFWGLVVILLRKCTCQDCLCRRQRLIKLMIECLHHYAREVEQLSVAVAFALKRGREISHLSSDSKPISKERRRQPHLQADLKCSHWCRPQASCHWCSKSHAESHGYNPH